MFNSVSVLGLRLTAQLPQLLIFPGRLAAHWSMLLTRPYQLSTFFSLLIGLAGLQTELSAQTCGTWTARQSPVSDWKAITYGNGLFVALSPYGFNGHPQVMTSPDGATWTGRTAAEAAFWYSVTYGNGVFVAVGGGQAGKVMTSTDGTTWTSRTPASSNPWASVTFGNGVFVAVANDNRTNSVMTSTDGVTWTSSQAAENNTWASVTYGTVGGNPLFVAVANGGTNRIMTSPDGINWTAKTCPVANWVSITYGNGVFVAVSYNGTNQVMTSSDGITWTARPAAEASQWFSVTYGNGMFVAVANYGTNQVMTSTDGTTWTACPAAETNSWRAVTYGNSQFVAVADYGTNQVMTLGGSSCTPPSLTLAATPSLTIASGGSLTLTASGAESYTWSTGESTTVITLSNITSATTLSVTGVSGGCSGTASAAVSVTMLPMLALQTTASPNTICVGKTATLSVTATGGSSPYTYNWQAPTGASITGASNLSVVTATASTSGVQTFTVTVSSDNGGPVSTSMVSITVNAALVSINPSTANIAGGQSVTLTATGATNYTWTTGETSSVVVKSPVLTETYSVTGLDGNGCVGTASAMVTVDCGETIQADAISTTQTVALSPGNCSVTLRGQGYGTGYTITGPNGYVFSAVYRNVGNYTLNALDVKLPGVYTLLVTYKDTCGRASSDSMTYVVTGEACN